MAHGGPHWRVPQHRGGVRVGRELAKGYLLVWCRYNYRKCLSNEMTIKDSTRFQRFCMPVAESGCWIWLGATTPNSGGRLYGTFYLAGKTLYAHRYSYEQQYGSIPDGLEIDHLCRVPLCVNPDHLEAVTHAVNMRRGIQVSALRCRRGHVYNELNTKVRDGARVCIACTKLHHRERAARRKVERHARRAAAQITGAVLWLR